jgi:hypothetical protein
MERQHRMVIVSGIISAAVGLLAGFLGGRLAPVPVPKPAAVIQAESFQLVNRAGQIRGRLGLEDHGVVRLVLFGRDAEAPLVSLAADPQGGAYLELRDDQGQSAVVLQTYPQGARNIALYHNGNLRLGLEVRQNGEPAVNLFDKGSQLITLGLTPQGDPHLAFYGEGQKAALDLVSKQNGDRSLTLYAKNGTPRLVLGLKDNKKAALGLFDRQGRTRVALMDEPSLILLKEGKLVRTLP